jgi:BirA family transcriptional regulator, biotin operon repressor / biotin---[acetyl-CoA-carboxylase] ligase
LSSRLSRRDVTSMSIRTSMETEPRPFDAERCRTQIAERGLGWGHPLTYRDVTGSTNDDALSSARAGAAHGSVFVADAQTAGRGRHGRAWWAAPRQSLLFSVLLRPETRELPSAALPIAVGLGVRAALQVWSKTALHVKWPNDVLAGDRKLAGVLCEAQVQDGKKPCIVVGVGLNLSQAPDGELLATTTCLQDLGARPEVPPPAREALLVDLLAAIESRVTVLIADGPESCLKEFEAFDALRGQLVQVEGATTLTGVASGVDALGRLLILSETGFSAIQAGTVRRLTPPAAR